MTSDGDADDSFGEDPPTQRGNLEVTPDSAPRIAEFSEDQTMLIARPLPAMPHREPTNQATAPAAGSGFSRDTQMLRQPFGRQSSASAPILLEPGEANSNPLANLSYELHHSERTLLAATGDHSVHSASIVEAPASSNDGALMVPDSSTGEGLVKAHSLFREQALQS